MPYLLDTNVFIQAKNLHYGFDFCPAFWDWLIEQNRAGNVYSIEKVRNELAAVADELSTWAAARGTGFFLRPNNATMQSLAAVSEWATGAGYDPSAVHTFLQDADYYLVAEGHARSYTVVTHELRSMSTKHIKLPNACEGVGVKFMTPFEMLRVERARFVLGPVPPAATQLALPTP